MADKQERSTEQPSGQAEGSPKADKAGLADQIGPMIQEAEKKGVKGALLSRLKKAKVGKVNLDPEIGQPSCHYTFKTKLNCHQRRDEH